MPDKKAPAAKKATKKKITFEKSLEKLEEIVKKMEGGELSLEESLKLFQEGVEHSKTCRELLAEAEYQVEYLLKKEYAEEECAGEDFEEDEE